MGLSLPAQPIVLVDVMFRAEHWPIVYYGPLPRPPPTRELYLHVPYAETLTHAVGGKPSLGKGGMGFTNTTAPPVWEGSRQEYSLNQTSSRGAARQFVFGRLLMSGDVVKRQKTMHADDKNG